MIDVRLLRNDPAAVKAALARRGKPEIIEQLDAAIALDGQVRDITALRDASRARVNELSKLVGAARRDGENEAAEKLQTESRALGDDEKALAEVFETVQAQLRDIMLRIPNVPHDDAPDGVNDQDNPLVKGPINLPAEFSEHQRVAHWVVADELGILDNERSEVERGNVYDAARCRSNVVARVMSVRARYECRCF